MTKPVLPSANGHLLIARNPDLDSRLPFLIRVPLGDGLVFRTSDTWPRTKAVYCYPVGAEEWPGVPDVVEEVRLKVSWRNAWGRALTRL